jgi:hypothetical protein
LTDYDGGPTRGKHCWYINQRFASCGRHKQEVSRGGRISRLSGLKAHFSRQVQTSIIYIQE